MPGIATARSATTSAARCDTSIRARRYDGTAASVITTTFRYLIASYASRVDSIHHAGAIRYAYADLNGTASPRRARSPVSAIDRDTCVHSSSSEKIHGVFRIHASTA